MDREGTEGGSEQRGPTVCDPRNQRDVILRGIPVLQTGKEVTVGPGPSPTLVTCLGTWELLST